MPLQDDQATGANEVLLGRFVAGVKAAASEIVEEPPLTQGHIGRMALAKRITMERQASNYARVMLELALARDQKLRSDRANIVDADIISIVNHYIQIFAAEGW